MFFGKLIIDVKGDIFESTPHLIKIMIATGALDEGSRGIEVAADLLKPIRMRQTVVVGKYNPWVGCMLECLVSGATLMGEVGLVLKQNPDGGMRLEY